MADPMTWWATAGRDVLHVVSGGLPQKFLRWRWPASKLLDALTVLVDAQPAFFCIGSDRPSHDLESLNFHVFNFSPLQLALVGAELDVQLHSATLLNSKERFATEFILPPFARGGFPFQKTLSEQQRQMVMREKGDLVRLRVTGKVIVKSPFGEHRKALHADTVASIVR